MTLDAHPAAAAFPMMNDKRFAELKSSISERGLNHPILLHDGMILDGRNRYRACVELGVDPRFVEYAGNPYQRAWEENGQRRDLEDGARYLIWKRLSAMDSEWQEEQLRIQEEANRARAEAARTQHEVSTPRHGETLVVGPNVPPPKPKGHKSREAKAKKTNVTPATVYRVNDAGPLEHIATGAMRELHEIYFGHDIAKGHPTSPHWSHATAESLGWLTGDF